MLAFLNRHAILIFAMLAGTPLCLEAQTTPSVTKDQEGNVSVTFPTQRGRLYSLEAAPDGINFAPVPGSWLYGSALNSGRFLIEPARDPSQTYLWDEAISPATNRRSVFLRLYLGETTPSTGLTTVTYARYFLDAADDSELFFPFYNSELNYSYLYGYFEENRRPAGAPYGWGIDLGPVLSGQVALALPSATLLSSRLNGGTLPLNLNCGGLNWRVLVQFHSPSEETPLEQELRTNYIVPTDTAFHSQTEDLLAQLVPQLLGQVANTTAETPPVIDPPVPGSLAGTSLRLKTYPAHLLSSVIPDDWFYANGYGQAFLDPSYLLTIDDADLDGLTLEEEYLAGSNPNLADTDADGFLDGADPNPTNSEVQPIVYRAAYRTGYSDKLGPPFFRTKIFKNWPEPTEPSPYPFYTVVEELANFLDSVDYNFPANADDSIKKVFEMEYSGSIWKAPIVGASWAHEGVSVVQARYWLDAGNGKHPAFTRSFLLVESDYFTGDIKNISVKNLTVAEDQQYSTNSQSSFAANGQSNNQNGTGFVELVPELPANVSNSEFTRINLKAFPVEILNFKKRQVSELKVAKMSDLGVITPYVEGANYYALNIDKDSDRFYIRIRGGAVLGSAWVKVETRQPSPDDDEYEDLGAMIELKPDPNSSSDLISKSLMLVSDEVDDGELWIRRGINDSGMEDLTPEWIEDNWPNDRTFKIQLGGKLVITDVIVSKDGSSLSNYNFSTYSSAQVPVKKTVNVGVMILRTTPGGTPALDKSFVTEDIKTAKERYAQLGIKLIIGEPTVIDHPPYDKNIADLSNGLEETVSVADSLEDKRLIRYIATPAKNDIQVFYVNYFTGYGSKGESFAPFVYKKDMDSNLLGNVIIVADRTPFTLAHELGHIITNNGHYENSDPLKVSINVMREGSGSYFNVLEANKRFTKEQENQAQGSSHAK